MAKFKPKNVIKPLKKKVIVVKKKPVVRRVVVVAPKKETPVKKEKVAAAAPVEQPKPSEVKLCDCGEPVALEFGQTEVCKNHIRRG